ncbi:uncharacterized protein VICG_02014 [Vittaforma corneae ATCC 50505]|uniref:Transcription factor TFIID subunit 8 C-terminal domain-containing protein n=1 Tax=Vittaforma corneae (strain ATCC 50505) TaxID=993615 RepID=L2GK86_VITCO|nr:uncharacterized protein VICG_02014 [Vittaforma corneae ATCC 50505]ELA40925.1 hypothetical protein VICG_02014 [Vittaforma corneae ATCC 50505]
MDEILKRSALELLKSIGFESIESKALELLLAIHNDRIMSYLQTNSKISVLSSRPSVSLLDLCGIKQQLPRIGNEIPFTKDMLAECNAMIPNCRNKSVQYLFTLVPSKTYEFPREILEEEHEWISPLSARVERFIHIYDFMPNFPPIHTFRMTSLKSSTLKNQSSKVKNRLEQSLRSEGSMVKLIKSSGSMPKFINYLYKGKV